MNAVVAEGLGLPTELPLGLAGVADEGVDLAGALVAGVVPDMLLPVEVDPVEGRHAEVAHGHRVAGGQDVVVAGVGLQHPPHALDVLLGVAPVADRVEVPEVERLLQAGLDAGDCAGDLAGHEGLAAAG